MSENTLGGRRVLTADVQVPSSGAWWGTVTLDASSLPPLGATVLTIGDLVLAGAVVRSDWDDAVNGGRPIATVRGGAGWGRPLVDRNGDAIEGSYSSAGGVKISTVLQDLAKMTGETIGPIAADVSIGRWFSWPKHRPLAPVHGDHVLADLVARGYLPTWRIEPSTGRTLFTDWPSIGFADGRGRIVDRARDRGRRTVGLDVQVAAFVPGATLEGIAIRRLILRASASELSAQVYDA